MGRKGEYIIQGPVVEDTVYPSLNRSHVKWPRSRSVAEVVEPRLGFQGQLLKRPRSCGLMLVQPWFLLRSSWDQAVTAIRIWLSAKLLLQPLAPELCCTCPSAPAE